MDEFKQIRDLLPEQAPPSPRLVAETRARLTTELATERTAPRRSARPRLLIPLAAATAAAVAAVVVVTLPSDDTGPAGSPTGQQAAPTSARDILLVAAVRAEADATKTGRFWRFRTVSGFVLPQGPFGIAPNTYQLERRTVTEAWLSRDGREPDKTGQRDAGVRPTNEAAWRADGAPTEWNLGYDTEIERELVLTTRPAEGMLLDRSPLEQVVPGLTAQQIKDLPTDAAALRAFLIKHRAAGRDEPQDARGKQQVEEGYLYNTAVALLGEVPAPPAVRAAALRLIADLGGVESTGPVTDPLGRKGTGITRVHTDGPGSDTAEIVIDAQAGTLLSSRHTGSVNGKVVKQSYRAVLDAGWTDAAPSVPSADVP